MMPKTIAARVDSEDGGAQPDAKIVVDWRAHRSTPAKTCRLRLRATVLPNYISYGKPITIGISSNYMRVGRGQEGGITHPPVSGRCFPVFNRAPKPLKLKADSTPERPQDRSKDHP